MNGSCENKAKNLGFTPLILPFSPWEKGRLNNAQSVQRRSLFPRESICVWSQACFSVQ